MKIKHLLCLAWVCSGAGYAQTGWAGQSLQAEPARHFVSPAGIVPWVAYYQPLAPLTEQSAGLAVRVHYDSSLLEPISHNPYPAALQPIGDSTADSMDADGDASTDKYFTFLWADFAAQWPGVGKTPLKLLDSRFKAKAGFQGATHIRTSAAATAYDTGFESTPVVVCAKPVVSVVASDASAAEQGATTAMFSFSVAHALPIECGTVRIDYQMGGTAAAGKDYQALTGHVFLPAGSQSVSVLLLALHDTEAEAAETVSLDITLSDNYTLADTQANATITIQNGSSGNLPVVTVAANRLKVLEGTDKAIELTAVRAATDISQPLVVQLQAEGSAQANFDYQAAIVPLTVQIPAGQTQGKLTLPLLDDAVQEQDETIELHVLETVQYQRGLVGDLVIVVQDDELRTNTSLATGVAAIPTLQVWGLLLLGGLLGWFARLPLHRLANRPNLPNTQRGQA